MCWFFIGCGSTDLVIIFSIHILVLHMDLFFHESKSFFEPLVRLFEESLYGNELDKIFIYFTYFLAYGFDLHKCDCTLQY